MQFQPKNLTTIMGHTIACGSGLSLLIDRIQHEMPPKVIMKIGESQNDRAFHAG